MSESLKEKTAKGLFWGGFSNGIQQLLNLFFGIFLARLLNADDYGMVGMLTIFIAVAGTLQESGFTNALTNKREVTHKDYNAVFWFSTLTGITMYILLFLSAPLIADFYDKPELVPLARYLFIGFLISSSATAHNAKGNVTNYSFNPLRDYRRNYGVQWNDILGNSYTKCGLYSGGNHLLLALFSLASHTQYRFQTIEKYVRIQQQDTGYEYLHANQ